MCALYVAVIFLYDDSYLLQIRNDRNVQVHIHTRLDGRYLVQEFDNT